MACLAFAKEGLLKALLQLADERSSSAVLSFWPD